MLKASLNLLRIGILTVIGLQQAQADNLGRLTAEIKGVHKKENSTIICALHESAESFPAKPEKALKILDAVSTGDSAICEFEVIQGQFYAVSVAHDENGNRKLDMNFLGIPQEGWATSQNITHTFRAPSFEESKVKMDAANKKISLDMHY